MGANNMKKLRKKALKAATRAEDAAARAQHAAQLVREATQDENAVTVGERPEARFTTEPRGSI